MAPVCGSKGYAKLVDRSPISDRLNLHTIVHEIGHMLGAQHTNWSGSVMDPLPINITSGSVVHFDVPSVDEIHSCMGG